MTIERYPNINNKDRSSDRNHPTRHVQPHRMLHPPFSPATGTAVS